MLKWKVQPKTLQKNAAVRSAEEQNSSVGTGNTHQSGLPLDEGSKQIRASCSLDFLNEIRGQNGGTLGQVGVNFNPGGVFSQSSGTGLSPVTPPPRHRYLSPDRRATNGVKGTASGSASSSNTPTPGKAVFILQKSESRESVHIDVNIVEDDAICNGNSGRNGSRTPAKNGSPIVTAALPVRSTEVVDEEADNQQTTLDHFKFSRTRSMRGPKGLRISKVYHQGRDSDTMAALTLSSEDEGKGNSDQSESPPPLPPRRHRSRPNTAMSSYRTLSNGHGNTLDTNSISSEESYPSIPCLLATDLHRLRVTGDAVARPAVPPKSPLITRIEVTGEAVQPTVIATNSSVGTQQKSGHHLHSRSRSEVIAGTDEAAVVKSAVTRLPPVLKKNNRTKSSDNIVRKNRPQTKSKAESNDSVDEGIVLSAIPTKVRSQSAGRSRKLSEEIECYNVYNVRTGKITTSVQKPSAAVASNVSTDNGVLAKRSDRHQNCKKCIHATKS